MKQLLAEITTVGWWISVVLVGILINLISAYVKNKLDSFLSTISKKWSQRTAEQRNRRKSLIDYLVSNPNEQVVAHLKEIRWRLHSLQYLLFSLILLVFSIFVSTNKNEMNDLPAKIAYILECGGMLLSLLAIFLGFRAFQRAAELMGIIKEARIKNQQ